MGIDFRLIGKSILFYHLKKVFIMHDLVTIVVLIVPFIFVIAVLWLKNNEKHKRQLLEAELLAKIIEKGQPIPTNFFAEEKKMNKPLNTGIVLISISVGIIVSLWLLFDALAKTVPNGDADFLPVIALVGIIPLLAGIAFVIIHFIGKKTDVNEKA